MDIPLSINRPSWEEYALSLALVVARRSCDPYVKVGSCALRHDNSVASVGYNGPPAGIDIDYSNRDDRRKRIIHSEINCLRYVKPHECYLLACTLLPCNSCLTAIASYGIKTIIFKDLYDKDESTLVLAKEFGMDLKQITI
jgi:dCMP deaminase